MRKKFMGREMIASRLIWLLGCLLCLTALAGAQPPGIKIEAKGGFDGYYRPGEWTPVFVRISNRSGEGLTLEDLEDFKGQLMMQSSPRDNNASALRFIREIDIPRESDKQYILYVKIAEDITYTPELILNSENGKTLATFPIDVQSISKTNNLMVNITEGGSLAGPGFPRLGENWGEFVSTKLLPSEMADHWAAYDSADVIVFPGWPASGLRDAQIEALLDWVQVGGTVVFLTGQETPSYSEPSAQKILPVRIDGSSRLWQMPNGEFRFISDSEEDPGDSGKSFVMAQLSPRPGAEVLAYEEQWPLAVRSEYGNGQMIVFANDFQAVSPELERRLGPLWFAASPRANLAAAEYEFASALQDLKTLTGRAARPPNQFLIIIICIIYTVIVGPVNFAILGRKKKLEWAWFTVPTIVLFFFFLVYGLGRLTRGGENIYRELVIQELREDESIGSELMIAGSFTASPGRYFMHPQQNKYTLADPYNWFSVEEFKNQDWGSLGILGGPMGAVKTSASAPVISYDETSDNIYIRSWEMGIYDAAVYVGKAPIEIEGTIDADVRWENDHLSGMITNKTPYDYDAAWLIMGNDVLRIGDLGAGKSWVVPQERLLRGSQASAGPAYYQDTIGQFTTFVQNDVESDQEIAENNFGRIMQAIWQPDKSGGFLPPETGTCCFLGLRFEGEDIKTQTNLEPPVRHRTVATIVKLNPAPPRGEDFIVTDPHLKKSLNFYTDLQADGFKITSRDVLSIRGAAGVFSVELPFHHPELRVTEVAVNPVFNTKDLPTEDLVFQIFVFSTADGSRRGRWVTIQPGSIIPNGPAAPMLDEDSVLQNASIATPHSGRLYFRVESVENDKQNTGVAWNAANTVKALGISIKGRIGD